VSLLKNIIVVLFLSALFTDCRAEEVVRLASGEWSPYQSKSLKYFGVASRIVTESFAESNLKVEYGYFPWKRSYKYAESGEWDGTFLWFDTPERRKLFYVSNPIIDIKYVFFHLKSFSFKWKTVDDLKGVKIGGTLEYNYGESFQKAEKEKKIQVYRVSTDKQNFKKMLSGRIQIFPNDLDAGLDILNKNFTPEEVKQFTYHPLPVKAAPHCLLLSKKNIRNKELLERFNKGLKTLQDNGKLDRYISESRQGKYNRK
jgi:polar amino acid transport system substrate-binding protein